MIVSKEVVYSLAASDFYSLIQQKDSRNLFDVKYKIRIGKESIEGKFRNVAEIIDRVGNRSPEIYGPKSLNEIQSDLDKLSKNLGAELEFYQSNTERCAYKISRMDLWDFHKK